MAHPWRLPALLHVTPTKLPGEIILNILVRDTVVAWQIIRRKIALSISMTQYSPITRNPVFPQGQMHKAYKQWQGKGLDKFWDLYHKPSWKWKSFPELQKEYGIHNDQYLQYMQVTSYCRSSKWTPEKCFPRQFAYLLIGQDNNSISNIYSHLQSTFLPQLKDSSVLTSSLG